MCRVLSLFIGPPTKKLSNTSYLHANYLSYACLVYLLRDFFVHQFID